MEFPGITWHKQTREWRAEIQVDNKSIFIGLFGEFDDAIEACKLATIKHSPDSSEARGYIIEFLLLGIEKRLKL